jgi:hypothetical protein
MSLELHLHIGSRRTGIAVRPDVRWPGMWRVHAPDGRVSDMVNLTRAKDAAVAWARSRGVGGTEVVRWDHRETAGEAPLAASAEFYKKPATGRSNDQRAAGAAGG